VIRVDDGNVPARALFFNFFKKVFHFQEKRLER